MNCEYVNTIVSLIGPASATSGVLVAAFKIYKCYVEGNKARELVIKKDRSGGFDVTAKGLTIPEMMKLVARLQTTKSRNGIHITNAN
mgnify:CR=1 FL=1